MFPLLTLSRERVTWILVVALVGTGCYEKNWGTCYAKSWSTLGLAPSNNNWTKPTRTLKPSAGQTSWTSHNLRSKSPRFPGTWLKHVCQLLSQLTVHSISYFRGSTKIVWGSVVPQMFYRANLYAWWDEPYYNLPFLVAFLRWCSTKSIHWMQKHGTVVLFAVGWQKFCPELLNSFRMDMMRVGLCWPVMRWTFATHSVCPAWEPVMLYYMEYAVYDPYNKYHVCHVCNLQVSMRST